MKESLDVATAETRLHQGLVSLPILPRDEEIRLFEELVEVRKEAWRRIRDERSHFLEFREFWTKLQKKLLEDGRSRAQGEAHQKARALAVLAVLVRKGRTSVSASLGGALWGLEEVEKRIAEANLRLVRSVVNVSRKEDLVKEMPYLDLFQDGFFGLQTAIHYFEPQRRIKFSTYAWWWIEQAVCRSAYEHARTIGAPEYIVKKFFSRIRAGLDWQVAAGELKIPWVVSLSAPLGEESDEFTREDLVTYPDQPPPEELADSLIAAKKLHEAIASLPDKEREILCCRFAIGRSEQTLQEVGDRYGVSRERIRQLEERAIKALRDHPVLQSLISQGAV